MKRLSALLLVGIMVLGSFATFAEEAKPEMYEGYRGKPSDMELMMDEKPLELQSFLISYWVGEGDDAYERTQYVFKLRDVAAVLKDTDAKFNIVYNKEDNLVDIISGEDYEPIESDLKFVDIENAIIKESTQVVRVNGKETTLKGIDINGHNYFRMSVIRNNVGNFMFKSDPEKENLSHIRIMKSDIPEFNLKEFQAFLEQKDYTLVFNWGPWCYYSKRALPIMEELQKFYEEKGDSIQFVGIVNQYDNFTLKEVEELYGGKAPWLDLGATPEAYDYLEKAFGSQINFFPLRFIMTKEGEVIGKEFFDYCDIIEEEFAEELGIAVDDLTDEQYEEIELKALREFLERAIADGVKQ